MKRLGLIRRLRAFMTPGDAGVILLCAAIALGSAVPLCCGRVGRVAEVTTPDGVFSLPLDTPASREVVGRDGHTLTVVVQDGRVCVQQADCPDRLCVNTGWIERVGQTAACLPAGVVITVRGEREDGLDAVAGVTG